MSLIICMIPPSSSRSPALSTNKASSFNPSIALLMLHFRNEFLIIDSGIDFRASSTQAATSVMCHLLLELLNLNSSTQPTSCKINFNGLVETDIQWLEHRYESSWNYSSQFLDQLLFFSTINKVSSKHVSYQQGSLADPGLLIQALLHPELYALFIHRSFRVCLNNNTRWEYGTFR